MSVKRTFFRFVHKCDVYDKSSTVNDTGQRKPQWTARTVGQECFYTPSGSSALIRTSPTMEEGDYLTVQFPHDAVISYGSHVSNIRDHTGEVIKAGPYEVKQIDDHVSFTGRKEFMSVILKSVIE